MATAAEKVVSTFELLENVLGNLPMKDLLLAQRVCCGWKSLINRSIHLQRALYLRPEPTTVTWQVEGHPSGQMQLIRHLSCKTDQRQELLNYCKENDLIHLPAKFSRQSFTTGPPNTLSNIRINPLLAQSFQPIPLDADTPGMLGLEGIYPGVYIYLNLHKIRASLQHHESSAASMFITQPPVTVLRYIMSVARPSCPAFNVDGDVVRTGGVRLGDLLAMMDRRVRSRELLKVCSLRCARAVLATEGE